MTLTLDQAKDIAVQFITEQRKRALYDVAMHYDQMSDDDDDYPVGDPEDPEDPESD